MGYTSTFLHDSLNFSLTQSLNFEFIFILFTLIFVPIFGRLADRWNVEYTFALACKLYILFTLPCFALLYYYNQPLFLLPIFIIYSMEQASSPALISQFLPANVRYTGVSLAYNVSMAAIGGLAPLMNAYCLKHLHMPYFIAYLLISGSVLALIVLKYKQSNFYCSDSMV